MRDEDKAYMSDILSAFKVTTFKLSETPTRFKLIIKPDEEFDMDTLDAVQELKYPIGIEIDIRNGVYLECLKENKSRKRRRLTVSTFRSAIPKKYDVGEKFNGAMREILSIEDICDFDVSLKDNTLMITNLETISYAMLKRIANTGCRVKINMLASKLILTV